MIHSNRLAIIPIRFPKFRETINQLKQNKKLFIEIDFLYFFYFLLFLLFFLYQYCLIEKQSIIATKHTFSPIPRQRNPFWIKWK